MYRFVYWVIPSGEMCSGYSIDYPSIALHAICKDTNVNDKPCIYCHVLYLINHFSICCSCQKVMNRMK